MRGKFIGRALAGAALLLVAGCASSGNQEGGGPDFLTRLECQGPTASTYKCFEGKFEATVAAEGTTYVQPNNVDPNRPPTSLYFSGGAAGETAPEMQAGMVVQNQVMTDYLNDLLAKIVVHSPRPYQPMTVHIKADFLYSASVTPEGDIYMNLGLLESAESEGEVAAVLAHEASHVILGHHNRLEIFETQKKLAHGAVGAVAIASSLKQSKGQDNIDLTAGANTDETQTAMAVATAIDFLASDVISSSWGREQEDEADLLGADMMVRANYNPEPGAVALERLATSLAESASLSDKADQRTQALEDALSANPSVSTLTNGLVSTFGGIASDALKSARGWFKRGYLSPEERRANYLAYVDREHSEALFFDAPEQDPFIDAKRRAKLDQVITAYKAVIEARTALENNDTATAKARIEAALSNRAVARDPVPRVVQAKIYYSEGNFRQAINALNAVRGRTLTPVGYYLWSDALLASGDRQQATDILAVAEQTYGDGMFTDQRIKIALRGNEDAKAEKLLDACLEREDPVKDRCKAAWAEKFPDDIRTKSLFDASGSDGPGGFLDNISNTLSGGQANAQPANLQQPAATPAAQPTTNTQTTGAQNGQSIGGGFLNDLKSLGDQLENTF